jgi:hypothetical protein
MEDQDEMNEDKAAQNPDPRFLIKVVVAGLALHLAGYAMLPGSSSRWPWRRAAGRGGHPAKGLGRGRRDGHCGTAREGGQIT